MVIIEYKNKTTVEYKNLKDMIDKEKLKISVKSLSKSIREQNYVGKLTEVLEGTNIIKIKWVDRFGNIYYYDYRNRYSKDYWDIIDFSE